MSRFLRVSFDSASEASGRHVVSSPSPSNSPLAALATLAQRADAPLVARDAAALAERVSEGRFHVAVIGQFKRGKSTLINALVGEPILPTGVVPVTAVVTVVRYGKPGAARVRDAEGAWRAVDPSDVGAYVSEANNPQNVKAVTGLEILVPSALLASGMCLVDTPGLGSVFTRGSEATRAFVPQIDAALVVLGADPPISEDEMGLIEEVSRHVRELVFVLNKSDRASDAERSEAKAFMDRILTERLGRELGPILEVSAAEQLSGLPDRRQWASLQQELSRLASEAGGSLVQAAERRGLMILTQRLSRQIDEYRQALLRPIADSERRIDDLRRCVADAEQALSDVGYLLSAEQNRLGQRVAVRRKAFLRRTIPEARRELEEGMPTLSGRGPALRGAALSLAQDISTRWLERWRAREVPHLEALYREAAERFVELANGFLRRLADSGEPALSALSSGVGPEAGLRVRSRVHYTELWSAANRSPLAAVIDLFRSRASLERASAKSADRYLERLLCTNAARIENDYKDRVLESRRLLESEVRARLTEVREAAERALQRARDLRTAGETAVQAEIERLGALERRIEAAVNNNEPGDGSS